MYDELLRMFMSGEIDDTHLMIAVNKRWITEVEKEQIISSKNMEP